MADSKISALTAAAAALSTHEFPVNESGASKKVTLAQVKTLFSLFGSVVVQQFVTPGAGTYTPTAGMKYCIAISTGGGGGGGGADTAGASGDAGAGGGGGAGGTCIEVFSAADIGASQNLSVGAVGSAGAGSGGGNGGTGGNTTFGTTPFHTATGGSPGTGSGASGVDFSATAGGAGGVPTGGTVNITGGDGGPGFAVSPAAAACHGAGGQGGASFWGGGARGPVVGVASLTTDAVAAGVNGACYGAGGSGGVNLNATTDEAGGTGMSGIIVVIEFV